MKRAIIKIDEELCNGCGKCVTACAEGAIKLVNGKAKLVKEQYCDGLGACIGDCPTGALTIETRDAPAFDPGAVAEHLRNQAASAKHEPATKSPSAPPLPGHGACPGMMQRHIEKSATSHSEAATMEGAGLPAQAIPSELRQWPVQLHLVSPQAPYFNNRELLLLSTCAPVASADVHWRFLRGRSVVVACPKLDRTEGYVEKLASILSNTTIKAVAVVRMEVPCCGGLSAMLREAIALTGRNDLDMREIVVELNGNIRS